VRERGFLRAPGGGKHSGDWQPALEKSYGCLGGSCCARKINKKAGKRGETTPKGGRFDLIEKKMPFARKLWRQLKQRTTGRGFRVFGVTQRKKREK